MLKRFLMWWCTVWLLVCPLSVSAEVKLVDLDDMTFASIQYTDYTLLNYQTDGKGRPIQLVGFIKAEGMGADRSGEETPNPAAFKNWLPNKKIKRPDGESTYLWNRGHGIGFQFAGPVTNDPLNIAPLTDYLNQDLMLHYEGNQRRGLAGWLYDNPDSWLQYEVNFEYAATEDKIPYGVTLAWRGVGPTGTLIAIPMESQAKAGDTGVKQGADAWSYVRLLNIQPGYHLAYDSGAIVQGEDRHAGALKSPYQWSAHYGEVADDMAKVATIDKAETPGKEKTASGGLLEGPFLLGVMAFFIVLAALAAGSQSGG